MRAPAVRGCSGLSASASAALFMRPGRPTARPQRLGMTVQSSARLGRMAIWRPITAAAATTAPTATKSGGHWARSAMSASHGASAPGSRCASKAGTGGSPLGISCGAGHGAVTMAGAPPGRFLKLTLPAGARGRVRGEDRRKVLTALSGRECANSGVGNSSAIALLQELGHRHPESLGQALEDLQRRIRLSTALELGYICLGHLGLGRQLDLRQALAGTKRPEDLTQSPTAQV